jgi:hypothetical protein
MSATGVMVTLPAMSRFGTGFRLTSLAVATFALAASASSNKGTPPITSYNQPAAAAPTPPAQAMDPRAPVGLWNTNFGAVKIEPDGGGLHGAWSYDRDGQQVIGYFGGQLEGNVLRLTWREPAQPMPGVPQLAGEGWVAFEPSGSSFQGKWWSTDGQRKGDWTGTRVVQPIPTAAVPPTASPYGGSTYGAAPTSWAPPPPPTSYAPPVYAAPTPTR